MVWFRYFRVWNLHRSPRRILFSLFPWLGLGLIILLWIRYLSINNDAPFSDNETLSLGHNEVENVKSYVLNNDPLPVFCAPVVDPDPLTKSSDTADEPIHLGFVVAGFSACRQLVTLLKSLLFHRSSRALLHFHILVDRMKAQVTLRSLFITWRLPRVEVHLYPLDEYLVSLSWIKNKHYSGRYGLMKLLVTEILPQNISKLIFLDTDVLFAGDVVQLHQIFKNFSAEQVIALAMNQSPWYLGPMPNSTRKPWPALGRGFNTGVMLLHLARVRAVNWSTEWRRIARANLANLENVALADQDIVNAVLRVHPQWVRMLPCLWNLQLGDNSDLTLCRFSHVDHVKLLHWNSPEKQESFHNQMLLTANAGSSALSIAFRRHFSATFQSFQQYDGNLLRRDAMQLYDQVLCRVLTAQHQTNNSSAVDTHNVPPASHDSEEMSEDANDECFIMRTEGNLERRVHLFYNDYDFVVNVSNEVTLVSQLSIDRLQLLERVAEQWPGPMSLALYASDTEALDLLQFIHSSPILRDRRNIAVHVVFKEGQFYPVNQLRNLAMNHSPTDWVIHMDFDFLPSCQLHEIATQVVAKAMTEREQRTVYIIPAFETYQYRLKFPQNKADLLVQLALGEVVPFRQSVWRAGHDATDYTRWRSASKAYQVQWEADFEPYVLVPKEAAYFDQRFVGFGWNKVAYIMLLDLLKYRFVVLPNAFLIHLPHAPSLDVARFRSTPNYRYCVNKIKVEYIRHLAQRFGVKALKYLQFRKDSVEAANET